jgi:hypothetical protein
MDNDRAGEADKACLMVCHLTRPIGWLLTNQGLFSGWFLNKACWMVG